MNSIKEMLKEISENKELEKLGKMFQNSKIFGVSNIRNPRNVKIESPDNKKLKKFDYLIDMADSLIKTYYDKDKNLILDLSKIDDKDYISALKMVSDKLFGSLKEISEKKKDDPCWDGYQQLGTKTKNGKEVPNCVPEKEKKSKKKK